MNILITGANSSLGEKLGVELESLSYKVICASSKPGIGQKNFNLNTGFDSDLFENVDLILHLAINPKLIITNIEREFFHLAVARDITLLYI
jgi:dTDP-4-dehydrorhamnose reductase